MCLVVGIIANAVGTGTVRRNARLYNIIVDTYCPVNITGTRYQLIYLLYDLIRHTASRCGFTPQYDGLENLYSKFRDRGFVILDFPCNQFGAQAPESDSAYAAFCKINYHVDFPQFHKVEVNGGNEHPLYHWLKTQNVSDSTANTDIKWNFTKFLVDRSGSVVKRFEPGVTIEELAPEVEKLLAGQ